MPHAPEDKPWDHLLHFQAAFSEVAVTIPSFICREHLVQARADSMYNVLETTEYTCTVPVCSIKELPSTQEASLLEVLL